MFNIKLMKKEKYHKFILIVIFSIYDLYLTLIFEL